MLEGVWKLDLKWKAWKVYSFAAIQAMQQPLDHFCHPSVQAGYSRFHGGCEMLGG